MKQVMWLMLSCTLLLAAETKVGVSLDARLDSKEGNNQSSISIGVKSGNLPEEKKVVEKKVIVKEVIVVEKEAKKHKHKHHKRKHRHHEEERDDD